MIKLLAAAVVGLALLAAPTSASAQMTLPSGFEEGTTVDNLYLTVGMTYAPDGRVFIVSEIGQVFVGKTDGSMAPKMLLNFRDKVNDASDRGMLGIALDKDFATNGWMYLLYVGEPNPLNPDAKIPASSRLTRVTVNPDNTIANPDNPETVLLGRADGAQCPPPSDTSDCIPSDYWWHSIGSVRVDPADGSLWLGSGDATSEETQAQAFRTYDETSFAGKIIHIGRDGKGLPGHPFCPAETDLSKVCTKLYAKGFRNPFRFTLRPGKGPIAGDVGYGTQEELDLVKAGGNYGWPCYEGSGRTPGYQNETRCQQEYAKENTADEARKPVYSYPHEDGGAVLGGPQYTGGKYPTAYTNDIFFGDYVRGWIKRLKVTDDDQLISVSDFASNLGAFTDLQQDPQGRLAIADVGGFEYPEAEIKHIGYSATGKPTARASADPTFGALPLQVQFTGSTSTDPTGQALTYDWDFGDGTAHSSAVNPAHTYTTAGTYTATLKVTDTDNLSSTATVGINAGQGNTAPTAAITAPAADSRYDDGQAIEVTASASDIEDGTLPDSAYAWQFLIRHNSHLHVAGSATGPEATLTTGNDHDADAHYEIRLTVTDSEGASTTKVISITPNVVKFTLNSSPPGAPVVYAPQPETPARVSFQSAVGYRASIAAAARFESGGRAYRFDSWSDGGARAHTVTIPATDSARVARYVPEGGATLRFTPSADTSVDASTPTTAYGGTDRLQVDGDPLKRGFVRFDVNGVAARRVTGTRLGLYTVNESAAPPLIRRAGGSWTEATTWNTQPGTAGAQLGTFADVSRTAEWFETPLTADAVTGDGPLSLRLDQSSTDAVHFLSRESASKPTLTVDVEPRRASAASAPAARADFDGDGHEDLAVGVPDENEGALADTGAVQVLYGGASGIGERQQLWTQSSTGIADTAEAGDAFGAALATGDFNGDGKADLAIGAPGESIGVVEDAGIVHVLLGGASGLTATGSQVFGQDTASVADDPEPGDAFGLVLAAGDANDDRRFDLAVGVPREDVTGGADAGAVHLLRGAAGGLTGTGSQFFTQASTGMGETPEPGDELGGALAFGDFNADGRSDLAAAAASEDLDAVVDAGVIHVLRGATGGLAASGTPWSQSTEGVAGDPETGDRFGSVLAAGDMGGGSHADLAVGVPDEDIGTEADAGWVSLLLGSDSGLTAAGSQRWYQGDAGIQGAAERGDRFGQALAVGDVGGTTRGDLIVGTPGDSIGAAVEAGAVHVLFGGAAGLSGDRDQLWSQYPASIADVPETGDRFGASVTALDLFGSTRRELVIG
ncbi:MAG TPA: PQQ-dependent sugar dehydrogenase, partial [Solirubrobacteraceae bacterium]